jgi:hypothetical protein
MGTTSSRESTIRSNPPWRGRPGIREDLVSGANDLELVSIHSNGAAAAVEAAIAASPVLH